MHLAYYPPLFYPLMSSVSQAAWQMMKLLLPHSPTPKKQCCLSDFPCIKIFPISDLSLALPAIYVFCCVELSGTSLV